MNITRINSIYTAARTYATVVASSHRPVALQAVVFAIAVTSIFLLSRRRRCDECVHRRAKLKQKKKEIKRLSTENELLSTENERLSQPSADSFSTLVEKCIERFRNTMLENPSTHKWRCIRCGKEFSDVPNNHDRNCTLEGKVMTAFKRFLGISPNAAPAVSYSLNENETENARNNRYYKPADEFMTELAQHFHVRGSEIAVLFILFNVLESHRRNRARG